jgi:hypothetical protein
VALQPWWHSFPKIQAIISEDPCCWELFSLFPYPQKASTPASLTSQVWRFAGPCWLDGDSCPKMLLASYDSSEPQPASPPLTSGIQPCQVPATAVPQMEQASGAGNTVPCDYRVEAQTGSMAGADTCARVFVQVRGECGETEVRLLAQAVIAGSHMQPAGPGWQQQEQVANGLARAPFQRGCLDTFLLHGLCDTGRMTHLRIGYDSSDSGSRELHGDWGWGKQLCLHL